jgi:hypothetical protein
MTTDFTVSQIAIVFNGSFPLDTLRIYSTHSSPYEEGECIKALDDVMKDGGPMKIWDDSISDLCDLFEKLIIELVISGCNENHLDVLSKAYLYACIKYDEEDLLGDSKIEVRVRTFLEERGLHV